MVSDIQTFFPPTRWGSLKQVQIPSSLITAEAYFTTPALVSYIVLLYLHRRRMLRLSPSERRQDEPIVTVTASRKVLARYTGYSLRTLDEAIAALEAARLIETYRPKKKKNRGKPGSVLAGASPNRYYLKHPDNGRDALETYGKINALPSNDIVYFTVPEEIISKPEMIWSLARLTSSEFRLYMAALWLATINRSNTFEVYRARLQKTARITDARTFTKPALQLEALGLWKFETLTTTTANSPDCRITLNDPTTGEPVVSALENAERNPANYYIEGPTRSTKFILNQFTEQERETLLLSFLPKDAPVVRQSSGDITIQCPYHADTNPSCSVSIRKRCFHCFGCGQAGTFTELLTKLKDGDATATMQQIAASRGESITFRDPDSSATAIYDYRDENGNLVKQILRSTDADGNKTIRQRHLGKGGGWVWNTKGLEPSLLYHRELLQNASVVCVTEGEKDADAVTRLDLQSHDGTRVVGVTSGGSDSWDASLADLLKGKRVIVMPDADEPGRHYRDAVAASLDAVGIAYRIVEFGDELGKDVSEFLESHSSEELVSRIGTDWVEAPSLIEESEEVVKL